MIPIRYCGPKLAETDPILKLEWGPGVVHKVTQEQAAWLLFWPDSYEDARSAKEKAKLRISPVEYRPVRKPEPELPPLVNLQALDAKALQGYARQHFNENLPVDMPVPAMRENITRWMARSMI